MKDFDMKRCWRTLRWYVSENKKNLLAWTTGFGIGFTFVQSTLIWVTNGHITAPENAVNPANHYHMAVASCSSVLYVITLLAIFMSCSVISNPLKTKQKRIAFFMLPATNVERYITMCCYAVVIVPLGIALAALVGDTLRALLFMLMGEDWAWGIRDMEQLMGNKPSASFWSQVAQEIIGDLVFAWLCSLFALGGIWLRKHSFATVGIALLTLTGLTAWSLTKLIPMLNVSGETVLFFAKYDGLFISLAMVAFIVLNYYVGYRLFKRFQIITPKWTNV